MDFATRAASTWWNDRDDCPPVEWIIAAVSNFISSIEDCDVCCIVDWDNSTPYPEGHQYHGKDRWGREHRPSCLGDQMSDWEWDYIRYDHSLEWPNNAEHWYDLLLELGLRDEAEEVERDAVEWHANPVHCAVRAALDMASAPSAGVLGFSAGDVRRMYPEGVPDWLFPPGERLSYWPSGRENGTFESLPDDAGLIL